MKTYCKLSNLPLNESAVVYNYLSDTPVTKRMMNLGITEGSEIVPVFISPFGDPVAYLVKDTLIALRKNESKEILVEKVLNYERV